MPAALVAVITDLFTSGTTAWIMGALAGFPIFIVVAAAPLLFLNGLVEIYMSSIWTLAYRELRTLESLAQAPTPQAQVEPAPGLAD